MVAVSETPNSVPPPGSQPPWGSPAPAGGQPHPPPTAKPAGAWGALDPLSRRLLKVAALLSLLLVGVIANSILHSEEDVLELNPVAAAAAKAESGAGFDFDLYVVYSSPALPGPLSAQGGGAYDADSERTRVSLSLDSSRTGPVQFVEVDDSTYAYTKSNVYSAALPSGKEWVRTRKDESREGAGLEFGEAMQILSDSGNVHLVGHESVDGRMTRHYRAEVSIAKLVELLREQGEDEAADAYAALEGAVPTGVSAEAWIDRRNLLRRMRFVMPQPGKEGAPPMTMDMRMDLFHFGAHPDVQLPDPDTVVEGPLDGSPGPSSASVS
jgi:hypothetical protein